MRKFAICDLRFAICDLRFAICLFLLLLTLATLGASSTDHPSLILVVGAPGDSEFATNFMQQASLWEKACAQADCPHITIGTASPTGTNDYDLLKQSLAEEPKDGLGQLWLVLVGHGTFDGKEARFNLRGPDLGTADLSLWLQPFRRPIAVIDTSSCSAPFINKLSAQDRVIITATRSGHEQNFARFGQYFAEAINNLEADLDKDGQVSLLEAFLAASRKAGEFYKLQGRLATEHALLDDNGDALGTPADWFRGLRPTKKPKDAGAVDGMLAHQFCLVPSEEERRLTPAQRGRRDALERAVFHHRDKKKDMPEDQYYAQLETLLLELAHASISNSNNSSTATNSPTTPLPESSQNP
jgi:hypothetical protein